MVIGEIKKTLVLYLSKCGTKRVNANVANGSFQLSVIKTGKTVFDCTLDLGQPVRLIVML